jgi:hypothetical protein
MGRRDVEICLFQICLFQWVNLISSTLKNKKNRKVLKMPTQEIF